MNNYLLQLLKEVKTLIIPGLGALTVTNESTGEILFMPYLKFDDGTLAKHIANKEGIEINDATNLISKFVREVTAELDKGNSYDMYQFGRFIKIDGEIAFEVWSGNASSTESTTPPVVEKKEEMITPAPTEIKQEEVKAAPVAEQEIVSEKPEMKAEKPKEKEIVVPPVAESEIKTEVPPVKEEKIIPPVAPVVEKPEAKAPVEAPKPQKAVAAPKKEAPQKEKVAKEPKPKKKSSVLSYILWGFLVLILGSGTFIAIKFDSLKKDFPILADLAGDNDNVAKGSDDVKVLEDEADVNIDSNTDSEPVPEDQVQVVEDKLPEKEIEEKAKKPAPVAKETPAPKPKKETTPKPAAKPTVTVNKKPVTKTPASTSGSSGNFDSSKSFHVIAGSFGSEANANKLAAKLRSQGFGDAAVTMHNGMHRVSVKGFSTLNEATAEAAKVQGSVPGAWVLKL